MDTACGGDVYFDTTAADDERMRMISAAGIRANVSVCTQCICPIRVAGVGDPRSTHS